MPALFLQFYCGNWPHKFSTPVNVLVRTGIVALERGQHTIRDERKETTEFNLGKSLL